MDLKQALIEQILKSRNNPYPEKTLQKLKLLYIQQIHDDLLLSRGKPIDKMTDTQLEDAEEIDFD